MTDPAGQWVYVRRHEPEGPSRVYTLRLPSEAVERIRTMASDRGEAHTALARAWVLDRLAAEEQLAAPERPRPARAAEPAPAYLAARHDPSEDALAWVRDRLGDLDALCARHGLRSIGVFGSVARGTYQPGRSDVDVFVTFAESPAAEKAERYLRLVEELDRLLGVPVDLVDADAVRNPFMRGAIQSSAVTLHDRT